MQKSYEETCEAMLKQLQLELEQQEREEVEVEELRAKTENARTRYYAAKLENERLQIEIDRHVAIHSQMCKYNDEEQNKLQWEVANVMKQIDDVVNEFDSAKREDLAEARRARRAVDSIPIDFSEQAMNERSREVDEKYTEMKEKLVEETKKFEVIKKKYKAENEKLDERDSAMEAFIKEQKMINVTLEHLHSNKK